MSFARGLTTGRFIHIYLYIYNTLSASPLPLSGARGSLGNDLARHGPQLSRTANRRIWAVLITRHAELRQVW